MKIQLVSIGKAHDNSLKIAIEDFTKRINNYFPCEWIIIPPIKTSANYAEKELKKAEAILIKQHLQKDDYLILLEENGKMINSVELSQFIQARANESHKRIIFLIGGAFGVDPSIKEMANYQWSLSKLVFPHMIVRLILAEQIYRACSILRNEKYHHI